MKNQRKKNKKKKCPVLKLFQVQEVVALLLQELVGCAISVSYSAPLFYTAAALVHIQIKS